MLQNWCHCRTHWFGICCKQIFCPALWSICISSTNKKTRKNKSKGESEAIPTDGAESGEKSEDLTPPGAGRRGAHREAKRKNRIPTSQQPEHQGPSHDRRGNKQPGREYDYRDSEGNPVKIRDDSEGHTFPDNPTQNRGPHFNDPQGNHYDF